MDKDTVLSRWEAFQKSEEAWDELRDQAYKIMKIASPRDYVDRLYINEKDKSQIVIVTGDSHSGYDYDSLPIEIFCAEPSVGAQYLKDTWAANLKAENEKRNKENEEADRKKFEELKARFEK